MHPFGNLLRKLATAVQSPWTSPIKRDLAGRAAGRMIIRNYRDLAQCGFYADVWGYVSIAELAEDAASVDWYAAQASTGTRLPPTHDVGRLLRSPAEHWSWKRLVEYWVIYLLCSGHAYVEMILSADQTRILALDLYQPDRVHLERDPNGLPLHWRYQRGSIARVIPLDRMIHWHLPDPLDEEGGVSPLTPAMTDLKVEMLSGKWNEGLLKNSAVPSLIYARKGPQAGRMNPVDKMRFKKELEEDFSGEQVGSVLVMDGDGDVKTLSFRPRDMQMPDLMKRSAMRISGALRVPPWKNGAVEPKYENYRQGRLAFWEDSVIPMLDRLRDGLIEVFQRFYFDVVPEMDLSKTPAMRDSLKARLDLGLKLKELSYTPNQINERLQLGMPVVPWGDTALVQSTVVPVEALIDEMSAAANEPDE